jgi:hypothetical protein
VTPLLLLVVDIGVLNFGEPCMELKHSFPHDAQHTQAGVAATPVAGERVCCRAVSC